MRIDAEFAPDLFRRKLRNLFLVQICKLIKTAQSSAESDFDLLRNDCVGINLRKNAVAGFENSNSLFNAGNCCREQTVFSVKLFAFLCLQ